MVHYGETGTGRTRRSEILATQVRVTLFPHITVRPRHDSDGKLRRLRPISNTNEMTPRVRYPDGTVHDLSNGRVTPPNGQTTTDDPLQTPNKTDTAAVRYPDAPSTTYQTDE